MSLDITLQHTVNSRRVISRYFLLHMEHGHVWRDLQVPTDKQIDTIGKIISLICYAKVIYLLRAVGHNTNQ